MLLINASRTFVKGDPKNYIPEEGIERISRAFLEWQEEEKFSRIVTKKEIAHTDYNVSPSWHVHVADGEEYRPIGEIIEELEILEAEAQEVHRNLKNHFK